MAKLRRGYLYVAAGWALGLLGALIALSGLGHVFETYRTGAGLVWQTGPMAQLIGGLAGCAIGHPLLGYGRSR
jgi:hypothetical protein